MSTTEKIVITESYKKCFQFIEDDVEVILVSGEAGTGKSVLINQIVDRYNQRTIVKVAPTGIASLNVGGVTVHSFFRLPFGVLTEQRVLNHVDRMMTYGTDMYRAIDMLIVDEISMVRADMLDAIDLILRKMRNNKKPFGGVQVIIVGDLYQLPPVVVEDDREYLDALYPTEYFFSSQVMKSVDLLGMWEVVILRQVFRQSDDIFIQLLNDIRVNANTERNIKILNEVCYHDPDTSHDPNQDIVLCMTNANASNRNNEEMQKLNEPEFVYESTTTGTFNVTTMITPETLVLKVGAKVMFTKNNDNWVNGTIGIVTKLTTNTIEVETVEDGIKYNVPQDTWSITKYVYDYQLSSLVEEVVGEFTQFPLMLAWNITVHKSQSLSFDSVTIDIGNGAFATGQMYVALSRCRSLDGITLLSPLRRWDIKVDPRIAEFYKLISEDFEEA